MYMYIVVQKKSYNAQIYVHVHVSSYRVLLSTIFSFYWNGCFITCTCTNTFYLLFDPISHPSLFPYPGPISFTYPSSPLKAIFNRFLCKCLISDFIMCSYESSNKWSRRKLNFNLELCANPSLANCSLNVWSLAEKACFWRCMVAVASSEVWSGEDGESTTFKQKSLPWQQGLNTCTCTLYLW